MLHLSQKSGWYCFTCPNPQEIISRLHPRTAPSGGGIHTSAKICTGVGEGGIFLVQIFWPKDLFWPWGPLTHYTNYETWTCTSKTKVILDYFWPIYCTFDFFTIFHSNFEEKIYFIAPIVILEKGRDIYWVKNIKPHQIYQWQRRKSKLYLLQPAPRVKHQIWACHKHPAYIGPVRISDWKRVKSWIIHFTSSRETVVFLAMNNTIKCAITTISRKVPRSFYVYCKTFYFRMTGLFSLEHMSSARKHFVADYKATCFVNMTFIARDIEMVLCRGCIPGR